MSQKRAWEAVAGRWVEREGPLGQGASGRQEYRICQRMRCKVAFDMDTTGDDVEAEQQ